MHCTAMYRNFAYITGLVIGCYFGHSLKGLVYNLESLCKDGQEIPSFHIPLSHTY